MDEPETIGIPVDSIVLDIDYEIIAHFSRHLYGSPFRAVEELVSNGFDAFATQVYVYVPGPQVTRHVVVWDNGWSMDINDLKSLWWVARSPKAGTERVIKDPMRGPDRKQIGKFGIGKLASYSVGEQITHVSRRGKDFYLVSVDYSVILGTAANAGSSKLKPYETAIRKLTKDEAYTFVTGIFDGDKSGDAVETIFKQKSWTLAVIGKLKKGLPAGRLSWIIGNSMPDRPDFEIWINDERVVSKLERKAAIEWDFGESHLVDAVVKYFSDARKKGRFKGEVTFGKEKGLDGAHPKAMVPYLELPSLGRVWGTVRIFDASLKAAQSAEMGRSWGFFVMVRDRLLNPDDALLYLNDPSFAAFYRSQFVIHADALDATLLADRERLQRDTLSALELELLQSAIYRAARSEIETRDEDEAAQATTISLLPTRSRRLFREPLSALSMRAGSDVIIDLNRPTVDRKPLGENEQIATISKETHGFVVNTSHPYYNAIADKIGGGRKAAEFYRIYDLFAIAERLLEGHLYDTGVDDALVSQILAWRDDLFRELARSYAASRSEIVEELVRASYLGDEEFEDAVAATLNSMGFHASRVGGAGNEDILMAAAVGPESYTFTFEAKGCNRALKADKAEVSGAANHRDAVHAEHAVIVAREFEGFKANPSNIDATVLKECRSVKNVSIMTVETLAELYDAISRFGFPLDTLKDVFATVETPEQKLARIRELTDMSEGWDNRAILDAIWNKQTNEAMGDFVPYRSVFQSRAEWRKLKFERFEQRLIALDTLANGRMSLNTAKELVYLRQSPEHVIAQIERSLAEGAI